MTVYHTSECDLTTNNGYACTCDAEFKDFMFQVNFELVELCGLDSMDLPDYSYRKAFDSQWSVAKTVRAAIAHAETF